MYKFVDLKTVTEFQVPSHLRLLIKVVSNATYPSLY